MYNHQLGRQQQQQLLASMHAMNNMNNMNNMGNMGSLLGGNMGGGGGNDDGVTNYDLNKETGIKNRLPNLRYHVFISKETTKELSDYILPEPWGDENGLLYKYLDYVWRCQLFDRQIKKFYCRNEGKLVFHSGLQRRSDGEFVYLLLIRNDADSNKKVDQKWRVALGIQNGLHSRNMSFVTKQELLKHYWRYDESLLPKRTLFYSPTTSSKDLIFNTNYRFEIDWEERLRTCKNRIYKTLSNDGNRKGTQSSIDESVLPIKELQRRFESETRKSISLSRANPRIGVPQAFIESKNGGYRLELLIPLTLYFSNRVYYFALALRPHHDEKVYEGMSILTREMAYANARLVGSIDSSWLTTRFATDNVGAAQHCSCTCHNFCNTGINPDHIHNLADHKRKYNNDIPHDRVNGNSNNNHHRPNITNKLKISTKSNGISSGGGNNNILSPSVTPRHSGHNTPNSHHNYSHSHNIQPKLNRTYSSDSNPYLTINNNNTQIRNRFNQNNHAINNNAHHISAFNMRMNGNVPLNPMNTMNMYSTTPGTPATATTTNPYSTALSMNSPNHALTTANNPLKNGINTTTTNPFSFVATTATGTTPNPYTTTTTNPYANTNTINTTNPYNPLSLLTSAANPVNPLNPTFITSVPNVPTVPNPTGAPLKTPLFTQNMSNTSQTSTNPSPQRGVNNSSTQPTTNNPLQITTPKPGITATTTAPITFLNPTGIPSVSNTSLAAYGIPTIGPPCLAGSSVVNMPIAQMSGPQSIGSSVPSSVPIINPSLPGKTQMTTALSNTINTMSTNNNNTNTNNNSNGINNNMKQNVNNNTNDNNNNSNPSQTTETNEKTENTESSSNGEGGIKNTQKSKIVKSNKDGQDLSQYQPEPLNVGAIEQKHDGQAKQGFSEDMFADASPRTKEVFNGLTFDEEDEVYSLQPSKNKNKSTKSYKPSNKDRDNKNIPRAKSFHTNPHLPPLSYASHHNGGNNNNNRGDRNNQYRSSSNNNILSKTPTSHLPSGSWKGASYDHSNTSSPPAHGRYNNNNNSGRDQSPFHLRQLHETVRQHSHDGIHRTKSEHIIVNTNKTNPFSNNNYNSQQPGSRQQRQRQQQRQSQHQQRHEQYGGYYGNGPSMMGGPQTQDPNYNNETSIYAQDYGSAAEPFNNAKMERIVKSQSQPSLADMMQMQVGHDQFQQFQEMNQNITNENQQQSNNKQNTKHTQLNSPIQEDHPSGMINMYHD